MTTLQWINAFRGSPGKHGVLLQKEDGASLLLKEGVYIHFGDNIPVRIVGFRFSGRTEQEGAGQPSSIMYKNKNDEPGECFILGSDQIRHLGYGKAHTGIELVELVS